MSRAPIDILIVGQGLAGSLLAWELIKYQFRVMVIDDGQENASQVAAGLINPVTGLRMVKSQDIETLLPVAMDCYRHLGAVFRRTFWVEMPMLRILRNEQDRVVARKRLNHAGYQAYLRGWLPAAEGIETAYGMLRQAQTGYLHTRALLQHLRDFLIAHASYRQERLDYCDIVLHPVLQWRELKPKHIIFCEGFRAAANPWFGNLPFQPAKGEILSCETEAVCPEQILNYGHWLIPLSERRFKTGATFDRQNLDTLPTHQAETALLTALQAVCPALLPASVCEHKAGIRPATQDKQPFIGSHPRHADLHIFNGFGAKGSLAIPWYCREFVSALKQQARLPATGHIKRYYDSHFPARYGS